MEAPANPDAKADTPPEEDSTTDDFRVYKYKVLPCNRPTTPHDWSQCPYYHEGETGRRRDPCLYSYAATACSEFRKQGQCARGDACPYAHNVFEFWLHPSRYRTQMCKQGPTCSRHICFFAHTEAELREPAPMSKPNTVQQAQPVTTSPFAAVQNLQASPSLESLPGLGSPSNPRPDRQSSCTPTGSGCASPRRCSSDWMRTDQALPSRPSTGAASLAGLAQGSGGVESLERQSSPHPGSPRQPGSPRHHPMHKPPGLAGLTIAQQLSGGSDVLLSRQASNASLQSLASSATEERSGLPSRFSMEGRSGQGLPLSPTGRTASLESGLGYQEAVPAGRSVFQPRGRRASIEGGWSRRLIAGKCAGMVNPEHSTSSRTSLESSNSLQWPCMADASAQQPNAAFLPHAVYEHTATGIQMQRSWSHGHDSADLGHMQAQHAQQQQQQRLMDGCMPMQPGYAGLHVLSENSQHPAMHPADHLSPSHSLQDLATAQLGDQGYLAAQQYGALGSGYGGLQGPLVGCAQQPAAMHGAQDHLLMQPPAGPEQPFGTAARPWQQSASLNKRARGQSLEQMSASAAFKRPANPGKPAGAADGRLPDAQDGLIAFEGMREKFVSSSLDEQNGVIDMLSTLLNSAVQVRDARLQEAAPAFQPQQSHMSTVAARYAAVRQLLLGQQQAQLAQQAQHDLTEASELYRSRSVTLPGQHAAGLGFRADGSSMQTLMQQQAGDPLAYAVDDMPAGSLRSYMRRSVPDDLSNLAAPPPELLHEHHAGHVPAGHGMQSACGHEAGWGQLAPSREAHDPFTAQQHLRLAVTGPMTGYNQQRGGRF